MTLFTADVRRDPYPLYARLRAGGPVRRDAASGAWLLLGYDTVRRAVQDAGTFSSAVSPAGTMTAEWMIFSDAPRHARLRSLVMRAFTPQAVARLEPRIHEIAASLLDAVSVRGETDLVADIATPLPLLVIAELLGVPANDLARFRHWSDAIVALSQVVGADPRAGEIIARARIVNDEMRAYLPGLIEGRRRRDDLLTRLVEADVDGERLGFDELLAFFQLLLVAGHETTTNLISNTVLALIDNPHELQRLRSAPELMQSAIEETIRWRSPVQAVFRRTRSAVTLADETIRAGDLVIALLGAANRDPTRFDSPDRFDVTRAPNPHLGFGHGVHYCVGAPLARLEARIALAMMLERWSAFERSTTEPWEPREGFHVHGPSRLMIRFESTVNRTPDQDPACSGGRTSGRNAANNPSSGRNAQT